MISKVKKYRYEFNKEFLCLLDEFSIRHIDDHRKVFHSAWVEWVEMNRCLIDNEIVRLVSMGYEGDVMEKIYHHVRFYLRKKNSKMQKKVLHFENGEREGEGGGLTVEVHDEDKHDKSMSECERKKNKKEIIQKIVFHIKESINTGLIYHRSPGESFDYFYNSYLDDFDAAVIGIEYLKRSYKNKYYTLVRMESEKRGEVDS